MGHVQASGILHQFVWNDPALSISTTTDFEALSISNSNSFVEDQVVPEITFEENQFEYNNNDRQVENDNDRQFDSPQFVYENNDSQFENDNNDSQFENGNNDSQFESTNSNNMSISCSNVSVNTTCNWKAYREAKEKKKNLEPIIQLLSSPVKHTVKWNLTNSALTEVIVNPLSTNPIKWPNTLKHFCGFCWQIVWVCLTILWDWHFCGTGTFVGLALKELIQIHRTFVRLQLWV